MAGLRTSIVAALVMAAAATLGDVIWANWIPQHLAIYGMTHGILLFAIAGLVLGVPARRPLVGVVAGVIVGALAAGSFYLMRPLLGYSGMFVSWVGLWVALAVVNARLHARRASMAEVAARGAVAAAASGVAFYAISGIWRPFDPVGWDYAAHFAGWTFAYVLGFAPLMCHRERTPGVVLRSA
jgi:hypothetical protein